MEFAIALCLVFSATQGREKRLERQTLDVERLRLFGAEGQRKKFQDVEFQGFVTGKFDVAAWPGHSRLQGAAVTEHCGAERQ